MKICIEHKGVKREIVGNGFNICGSREDLDQICHEIAKSGMNTYGWIQVRDPVADEHSVGPNTPPLKWGER